MPAVRPRRATTAALIAAATLGLLAACGDSAGTQSTTTTSGSGTSANPADAFTAFRDCLQRNGVTLPADAGGAMPPSGVPGTMPSGAPGAGTPGAGGPAGMKPPGVADATWQKAQQACGSLMPSGAPGVAG